MNIYEFFVKVKKGKPEPAIIVIAKTSEKARELAKSCLPKELNKNLTLYNYYDIDDEQIIYCDMK